MFVQIPGIQAFDVDIRAKRHLDELYNAQFCQSADWSAPERRHDLKQFTARLIF